MESYVPDFTNKGKYRSNVFVLDDNEYCYSIGEEREI